MNGVCGIISFDKTDNLSLIRIKMEQFLCGDPIHIEFDNISALSVYGGDFSEYIYADIHILCAVIGKTENLLPVNGSLSNALAQLYIKFGKSFTEFISGSFAIIIYDFNKREFMLFEDEAGSIPLFYTLINNTLYFSTNINSLFEIPENKKVFSFLSINKLFTLSPALKSGETIYDNVHFLPCRHHIVFNRQGLKACEHLHTNGKSVTYSLESYDISKECNPYCIADIKLSPNFILNPFILESARKTRKFTNQMLIDILFQSNLSFSFETPFFVVSDTSALFSVMKENVKENMISADYSVQSLYDEITNMDFFNYTDEQDIERCEIIFLNERMLIPQISCDIFSFLSFFNIRNESVLNSPQAIDYIISMSRYKNINEILSEMFMTDISLFKKEALPDKFCLDLKNMCRSADLKIFKIFDRFRLFEKAEKLGPRVAMYILQINYLLEKKNITLEF